MREDKDGGRWCTPACLPACLQHPALQEWDTRLRSPGGGSGRSGGLATIGRRLGPDVLLPSRRQSGRQQTAAASLTAFVQMPPQVGPRIGKLQTDCCCAQHPFSVCGVVVIFSCFVFVFHTNNPKVKIECNPAKQNFTYKHTTP